VRRQARASSAGSTKGNGNSRGLFGRAFAARGVSHDSKGSGGPSIRPLALAFVFAFLTSLLFASAASAAAPAVTIEAASQVGFSTAKAKGSVNPEDKEASYRFEYVSQAHFEAEGFANAAQAGNGSLAENAGATPVTATLEGLNANTTYHLRLVAENADGSDEAAASTFATQIATAPSLALNPASAVKFTAAHISATVDPNGGNVNPIGGAVPIKWELQYSATPGLGWSLGAEGTFTGAEAESSNAEEVKADLTGLQNDTEYKTRLVVSYAGETAVSSEGSFETDEVTAPAAVADDASLVTGTTAHFSGHVTPGNADPAFDSACRFEYVTDAEFQLHGFGAAKTIDCAPNPVKGASAVEVTADPSELEPHTTYRLRLWAQSQGGTSTDDATNTFLTETTAPVIGATVAHEVTTTTATLSAQVNPRGAASTYHFEYLTLEEFEDAGESFGGAASTPESASVGSDNQGHPASAAIEGLSPGTAYRFRVVASNAKSAPGGTAGPVRGFNTTSNAPDSCPNAAVRSQQGSISLPDCRAYEIVSPVEKSGNNAGSTINLGPLYSVATADGNAILYSVNGPQGAVQRGIQRYAVGRRVAGGWSARSAIPAGSSDRIYAISYPQLGLVPSSDMRKILFTSKASYVPDNPVTESSSAALYMAHEDGGIDWLSRPQIPDPEPAPGGIQEPAWFQPVGASPDLSTVYFWSGPTLLTADAARAPFYIPGGFESPWGLYEYTDGELKPAGTLPGGGESPGGAAPASSSHTFRTGPNNLTTAETTSNQVSRDGSTLWFVSPDPGPYPSSRPNPQLYVRRDGHSTLVSHTPGGAPAPSGVSAVGAKNQSAPDPQNHEYAYGSADGRTAIFQSEDALAAGAPNDSSIKAYRYDVETDSVSYLPGVGGSTVVAATDDGSRFLFGGPGGIKVWDHGTIKTLTSDYPAVLSPARATASGSVFVFSTGADIAGFNHGGVNAVQIYRYDLAREKLTCASCPPDDVVPSGPVTLSPGDTSATPFLPTGELVPNRGISSDGDRVFFDSPDPLVPQDTNGQRDVYEWTPRGVSLISTGKSPNPSYFLDNSADGKDVFFASREGLDPVDTDDNYDVYDAHVDGGFLKPVVVPCSGEACRSGASAPPGAATAASASFSGAGNKPPSKPKHKKKQHRKKKSHKRAAGHNGGGSK
jgi:hypothetical protein